MDLHDALHDLHRDFRGAATDRPAGPVVAAARRRRARTRVGYSAVGAGAVVAVVAAGLSLHGPRPTPPPAETSTTAPTPTPSATPTPTPAAEPSPTPTWTPTTPPPFQPDLSACGTVVGDGPQDPFVYSADAWAADPGAAVSIPWRVVVDGAGGDRVAVSVDDAYLTQGGPDAGDGVGLTTVIGVPTTPLPGRAARVLEAGLDGEAQNGLALPLTVPFVMCPGVDGAGGPPPNGDYLVWARVSLEQGGTTRSSWGFTYGRVGAWADDPRFYLPEGTTRYDAHADDSGCDQIWVSRLGITTEQWLPTTGRLTARASGRLEDGRLIVSLSLTNSGKAVPYLQVRYPSFYIVANQDFAGQWVPRFPAGRLLDAGNTGPQATLFPDDIRGETPRWTARASLPANGSLDLETALGPTMCVSLYGDPWPSIGYTIFAFTEVALPDGTVTRIQAAPMTFTAP